VEEPPIRLGPSLAGCDGMNTTQQRPRDGGYGQRQRRY
jgi:hypothetical protein